MFEKVLSTNSQDFYMCEGTLFAVWNFSEVSNIDMQGKMINPEKFIPSYITKPFEEMKKKPLAIFQVSKWEVMPVNMNLFTYEAIVKANKEAHPALRSAHIQQNDDYSALIIACEPHDEESELTRANRKIITDYVREHKKELLKVTKKEYIEVEMYA